MTRRTTPPFRADHVGSLLRPPALHQARADFAAGLITAGELCEIPPFARQAAPRRLWRIPAVSCFLMATTGLLALHYL